MLRVDIDRDSLAAIELYSGKSKICALWHNRLFTAPLLCRLFCVDRPVHALVSPSKDGAWLTELLSNFNIATIRGSSGRRGQPALMDMLRAIQSGDSVAITPDGPRGPKYVVKQGIATLAKKSNAPLFLCNINMSRYITLNSWDNFRIPLPFSKISLHVSVISQDAYANWSTDELLSEIQNTLSEALK